MRENPYHGDGIKISKGKEAASDNGQEMKCPNNKKRNVLTAVLAVIVALICFLSGCAAMYFTLDPGMRALMRVKETIDDKYYENIDEEDFYRVLFDAVNEELLDPYSAYMTTDEYADEMTKSQGVQSGVGLVFRTEDSNGQPYMLIDRVCGNSPAERAGLTAGECVVGFGATETELQHSEVFAEFSAFLQTYATGETFYVEVKNGENTRVVKMQKEQYVENYVFYRDNRSAWRFEGAEATDAVERGEPLACLNEQTAYVRLVQFNGNAAKEFKQAMALMKTQGKKHLVLDLRGNGGGFLDIMQSISSYFCKDATAKKPVVAVAEYQTKKEKFAADGNYFYDYFSEDSRICVLADSMTASASECLIGSMIDYGAIAYADICLSYRNGVAKTYGKGIMQTTYPYLLTGDALRLTTAKIVWPKSGRCIHGIGVLPTDGAITVEENYVGDVEIADAVSKLFS